MPFVVPSTPGAKRSDTRPQRRAQRRRSSFGTVAVAAEKDGAEDRAPVVILVALSIAVGAAHVVRPLFAGREPLVAGVFGLVHGLAFASTLESLGLRGTALVLSLGAFNVGLELVQLGVIVAFAPLMALAARAPSYARLRAACAGMALLASASWVLERISGTASIASELLASGAERPGLVRGVLWLVLAAWALASRQPRCERQTT